MNCSRCGVALTLSETSCPQCGMHRPRRPASSKSTGIAVLVGILVGVLVFGLVATAGATWAWKRLRPPADPIAQVTTALLDTRFPALKAQLEQLAREGGDVSGKTRELSANGLLRLTDQSLEDRAALMVRVLDLLNPKECAALGRGQISGESVQRVLYAMTEDERSRFLAFSLEAADAEVRKLPAHPVPEDELRTAFAVLHESLAERDRDRFVRAMTRPDAASDADLCWMTKRLYAGIAQAKDAHVRAVLARAVVMP